MTRKNAVLAVVMVAAIFAAGLFALSSPSRNSARAFAEDTGQQLPAGVSVVAYREATGDNFLHTSRYWLLKGDPDSLRQLADGPDFAASLEDSRLALPDMPELFRKPWQPSDVVAGFEQDQGRGRWYWIFSGEREALYALD